MASVLLRRGDKDTPGDIRGRCAQKKSHVKRQQCIITTYKAPSANPREKHQRKSTHGTLSLDFSFQNFEKNSYV
jgi:hypothetical protein